MTTADIIAELEAICSAQPDPEGYYTTNEWAKLLDVCTTTAGRKLDIAKDCGRLSVIKVKREARNGKVMPSYAYRILPG